MGSIGPGSGQKTAQGVADLLAQLGREEAPGGGNYFPVRVWENWEKQERKEGAMASAIWQQTAEPTKTGNFLESQGILGGFALVNSGQMVPFFLFGAEKLGFFCAIRTKELKRRLEG